MRFHNYSDYTGEVSHIAPRVDPFGQPLQDSYTTNLVIVPFWVRKVFERNKLDYIELFNFDTLRKVLSLEDIANFVSTNEYEVFPVFGDSTSPYYTYSQLRKSVSDDKQNEIDNVVYGLAETINSKKQAIERFNDEADGGTLSQSSGKLYRFQILDNNTVLLFAEKGLTRNLENRSYAKEVVSDYLKVLYSLYPISDVSKLRIFETYLKLL